MSHLKSDNSIVLKPSNYKKEVFVYDIKMSVLSLNELKAIARIRGIKGYKSVSRDKK